MRYIINKVGEKNEIYYIKEAILSITEEKVKAFL